MRGAVAPWIRTPWTHQRLLAIFRSLQLPDIGIRDAKLYGMTLAVPITDAQKELSQELRETGWPPQMSSYTLNTLKSQVRACAVALGEKPALRGSARAVARAYCAEIRDARANRS